MKLFVCQMFIECMEYEEFIDYIWFSTLIKLDAHISQMKSVKWILFLVCQCQNISLNVLQFFITCVFTHFIVFDLIWYTPKPRDMCINNYCASCYVILFLWSFYHIFRTYNFCYGDGTCCKYNPHTCWAYQNSATWTLNVQEQSRYCW